MTRVLDDRTPVWPGDARLRVAWTSRLIDGGIANVASLTIGAHVGTHIDAPYHVREDGTRIGELPLETFIGCALVADVTHLASISATVVTRLLDSAPTAEMLLLRTGAWVDPGVFPTHFPPLESAAASILRHRGVRLLGTDAPSVDSFDSEELPAHRALLGADIVILENLDLGQVPVGLYELIAFPLRLRDTDASPVRAVLRTVPG